jgi:uncharacterized damage-inducible protein DinB
MESLKYIKKLLNDHYRGNPWIDVTISDTLNTVTAGDAALKVDNLNSIWQITNHMIAWREKLLERIMDKSVEVPDNNFIYEVEDTSEKAWTDTIKKFERSQEDIISFLSKSNDMMLEKISPASGYSYFELAMAILLHDAYHLGQIVLIKKLLKK